MVVKESRVGIVGGSIAGCAAAIALARVGCAVTVLERSRSDLRERGFGIGMPVAVHEQLVAAGYLDAGMAALRNRERFWIVRDQEADGDRGRVAWRHEYPAMFTNWGLLWRTLRDRVPDEVRWRAAEVIGVAAGPDGVTVTTDDGRDTRFDVLVGADGYRSMVRPLVGADQPVYAGYSLWRGNYPADRLPGPLPRELDHATVTVGFPGGHGIFYLIPDLHGHGNRINWAIYATLPAPSCCCGVASMPPGSIDDETASLLDGVLAEYLPPYWADVVRRTERAEMALQPVYDATAPRYAEDRLLLVGDAGTVARPHTVSGATKALQDALALERIGGETDSWEKVLAGYDAERAAPSNALVDLGQRMGHAQVVHTPDWAAMTAEDYESWLLSVLAGRLTPYDS